MFKSHKIFFIFCLLCGIYNFVLAAGFNNKDTRYSLREFRRFILPNQLKVMLISDPTLQKGAASLTVAVGSMNDPLEILGMSHFIEHMLFLGNKKYPDEGSFQKFISIHNGYSNAYTTDDRTNFHFEIDPNYLEEGLDRFSQFFISPLFKKQIVKREMRAIDSEHSKNISNDFRRIFQVKRKAFEKNHPASHFATGSIETLEGVTREELLSFFKKYYSSNQMMLAVAGPQDLKTLQDLVIQRFNKIKNLGLEENIVSSKFLRKDSQFRLMEIKTIKDSRYLKLIFPLTKTLHYYKSRPLGIIGFLIGHEGSGSLLSLLKSKNLATNLSAGVGTSNKSFSSFEVDIKLTKKGIQNYKKIIEYFFKYINLLRKKGLPRYVFEEVKLMSEIEYKFAEKLEGISLVNSYSTLMMYYPMRTLEVDPFIITDYKPRIFDSILYNLIPENMLAILAFRNARTNKIEEFYSVEYSLKYSNPNWIKKLRNSKNNSLFKLPKKNKFLPKRLEILDFQGELKLTHQSLIGLEQEKINPRVIEHLKTFQEKKWESIEKLIIGISPQAENEDTLRKLLQKHVLGLPKIIIEDQFSKIWFMQDFRFKNPKAKLIFRINTDEVYSTPRNAVLSQLYVDSILEGLNEFGYPVRLSGLDYDISFDKKGIFLSFGGFSDRILELTKTFASRLKNITINKKTFKNIKESLTRRYKNFVFQQPYKQAIYYRNLILQGHNFSIAEYEKEIKKIKLHHLREFTKKLYKKTYIEGMAHGNLNTKTLIETIRKFRKEIGGQPLMEADHYIDSVKQISFGTNYTFIHKINLDNSAVLTEFQIGQQNPKLLAQLMMIEILIKSKFYNDLRVKQQLGYIVDASISVLGKTLGLMFLIQSGEHSSKNMSIKIDKFLENFFLSLKNISNFEINKLKKSILQRKLQKTNSINSEALKLFKIAFEKNAEFDINSKEIKAIEQITRKDILDFVQDYLLPHRERKLMLWVIGKGIESENFSGEEITIIDNFREKYKCPKHCLP